MLHTIFSHLFILSCLYIHCISHFIPLVKAHEPFSIQTYINQAKQIEIPFKKCFQVSTQIPANSKFISFEPSSLKLTSVSSGKISENQQKTVLEELRSPQSSSHEHLIVFSDYAIVFSGHNILLIIKQIENEYKVVKKIQINELSLNTRFKVYKFNNQAIMFLHFAQNEASDTLVRAFTINQQGYFQVKIPKDTNLVSHFEADGKQFFTSNFEYGVNCYSYDEDKKQAVLVASYRPELFRHIAQNIYLVDININSLKSDNIIYVLDSINGVIRINLTESQKNPKIQLIVSQPNCNAMDSLILNHIVLVCQLSTTSYIVEIFGKNNENNTIVFQKTQPQYHLNYFNDLEIDQNYYLTFSRRTLNVYWSSKQNNIPETANTRSQLDLPGLETFFFSFNSNQRSYLYVVQSGVMKKMLIEQSQARLSVKSATPVEKTFKVSTFGDCRDLSQDIQKQLAGTLQAGQSVTCEWQTTIKLEVGQQVSPRKQDFSVSASIIVNLIVIFLLVIWICLKKYKGLEREARKVLEAYKKKRSRL